jgi:hypothetical protein
MKTDANIRTWRLLDNFNVINIILTHFVVYKKLIFLNVFFGVRFYYAPPW